MTNNKGRADRGHEAIERYAAGNGYELDGSDSDDDYRAAAVDLMADVLHALASYKLDSEAAHAMTWRHFVAEKHDE